MRAVLIGILAATLTFIAPGLQAGDSQRPASIPFVDLGGINDWRPVGDEGILIEARNNKWYKATFFSRCFGLQYSHTIGFVTEPGGNLNRFSSIIVDGERCWFKNLEEVPASELVNYKRDNRKQEKEQE